MCSTSNTDLRPRLTATVNGGGGVGGCRTELREEGRGEGLEGAWGWGRGVGPVEVPPKSKQTGDTKAAATVTIHAAGQRTPEGPRWLSG